MYTYNSRLPSILPTVQPFSSLKAPEDAPSEPNWLAILESVLGLRAFPVVLTTGQLMVLACNKAAIESPEFMAWLSQEGGRMRFKPPLDRRLQHMAKSLLLPHTMSAYAIKERHLRLSGQDGAPCRLLSMQTLDIAGDLNPLFLISLRAPRVGVKILPQLLISAFELTQAEANLAAGLAEGLSLQAYAARERLKITTVRWHLKNIFERTETHSQAELLALIFSVFG